MKRILLLFLFLALAVPGAFAQKDDHIEAGVFANYFRATQTTTNFAGLGARFGFGIFDRVKLEAETAYDFNQVFTEGFTDTSTGTVTLARSNLRVLHGMLGPKLSLGHGRLRPFLTVKGGGLVFLFDNRPATFNTFASSVQSLRTSSVNPVLYPGGGLDGHIGPIGLRLDVGDEIYFNGGAHHNLRLAFGPYIRF